MKKNILVLGCGGFIGTHLINHLVNDDTFNVIGFDVVKHKLGNIVEKFEFHHKDIYSNMDEIEDFIKKSDAVIFLASLCNPSLYISNPIATIRSNFINPHKLVDMCAEHKKWFISFSTCEVYGKTISSMVGDNYTNPDWYVQNPNTTCSVLGPISANRWSYASAKELMDRYIYANYTQNGMPFSIIRPYNFFGGKMDFLPKGKSFGMEPRLLASFTGSLMRKEPIPLVDGGNVRRVFTDIDDAVDAIVTILKNKESAIGKIFHIGNPENEISIRDIAVLFQEIYAEVTNTNLDDIMKNSPTKTVSAEEFYGIGYEDCDRRVPDITEISNLGWVPKYNLKDTIKRAMVNWISWNS